MFIIVVPVEGDLDFARFPDALRYCDSSIVHSVAAAVVGQWIRKIEGALVEILEQLLEGAVDSRGDEGRQIGFVIAAPIEAAHVVKKVVVADHGLWKQLVVWAMLTCCAARHDERCRDHWFRPVITDEEKLGLVCFAYSYGRDQTEWNGSVDWRSWSARVYIRPPVLNFPLFQLLF